MPTIPNVRPQRTQVGLLLAKPETTFNVDSVPTVALDAFLVENMMYRATPQTLRRNPQRRSFGNFRYRTGRRTVELTFRHELKGKGDCGSINPKVATLLRGCGMALTTVADSTATVLGTPFALPAYCLSAGGQTLTWAKTTNVPNPKIGYGRYRVTCIVGGASATANLRVSGNPMDTDNTILSSEEFRAAVMGDAPTTTLTFAADGAGGGTYTVAGTVHTSDTLIAVVGGITFMYKLTAAESTVTLAAAALAAVIAADARFAGTSNAAGVITITLATALVQGTVVTSGTTGITIGASGAVYTPTWTGNLVAADQWRLELLRPGVHVTPVTNGHESMTFYVYRDGNFHKITGAMGSCRITGKAGEYLQCEFTFMGQFIEAQEATFPTSGVVFEQSDPVPWELAQIVLGDYSELPVDTITLNLNNTVTIRPDASKSEGYNGYLITQRDYNADILPEAITEGRWAQYRHFTRATIMPFGFRLGNGVVGNSVYVTCPSAQITNNQTQDQNNLQYNNVTLAFSTEQDAGDDDLRLVFC